MTAQYPSDSEHSCLNSIKILYTFCRSLFRSYFCYLFVFFCVTFSHACKDDGSSSPESLGKNPTSSVILRFIDSGTPSASTTLGVWDFEVRLKMNNCKPANSEQQFGQNFSLSRKMKKIKVAVMRSQSGCQVKIESLILLLGNNKIQLTRQSSSEAGKFPRSHKWYSKDSAAVALVEEYKNVSSDLKNNLEEAIFAITPILTETPRDNQKGTEKSAGPSFIRLFPAIRTSEDAQNSPILVPNSVIFMQGNVADAGLNGLRVLINCEIVRSADFCGDSAFSEFEILIMTAPLGFEANQVTLEDLFERDESKILRPTSLDLAANGIQMLTLGELKLGDAVDIAVRIKGQFGYFRGLVTD